MASEIPPPAAQPVPPPQPPPGATRQEWQRWRHQQRDQMRAQWGSGGSYGWSWWRPGGWFWPAMLIVVGVYFLLDNLGLLWWVRGDVFWPVVLILLGVALLVRRAR